MASALSSHRRHRGWDNGCRAGDLNWKRRGERLLFAGLKFMAMHQAPEDLPPTRHQEGLGLHVGLCDEQAALEQHKAG